MKWAGVLAALLLVLSGFIPWVLIESKNIIIRGVDTTGTNYGKPAYLHFILAAFFAAFTFIRKIWAKRLNLLIAAINSAWAARNYFVVTACAAGECPITQTGIWLMIFASILILVSSFFPDMELPQAKNN